MFSLIIYYLSQSVGLKRKKWKYVAVTIVPSSMFVAVSWVSANQIGTTVGFHTHSACFPICRSVFSSPLQLCPEGLACLSPCSSAWSTCSTQYLPMHPTPENIPLPLLLGSLSASPLFSLAF